MSGHGTPGLPPVSFSRPVEPQPRRVPAAARAMGPKAANWTPAENALLEQHYRLGGVPRCLPLLPGRTPRAVYQQAAKLGIACAIRGPRVRVRWPAGYDDDAFRADWAGLPAMRGAVSALADRLGVSRAAVTKRAVALGLSLPHRKEPRWTPAEDALLDTLPLHDLDRAAAAFRQHGYRRSATAIRVRATKRGLSTRYAAALSASAAARIIGCDAKTVTTWCLAGDLPATRRGTQRLAQQGGDTWDIAPADLRRFIIDHIERIDIRRVDKIAFVLLLAGEGFGADGGASP
ncbi:MAG: hypothetical protein OHK0024_24200 [Thalassobaculales bacterium]